MDAANMQFLQGGGGEGGCWDESEVALFNTFIVQAMGVVKQLLEKT